MRHWLVNSVLFFLSLALPLMAFADELKIVTATGKTISLHVEIADTPQLRETGLMGRTRLDENAGMLFVFDEPVTPQFWMKDTPLALDMVFIGADGRIKAIHPDAKPYNLTPIPAPEPVLAVLEIKGGGAKTLGFSTGAQVIHRIFENHLK